MRKISTVGLLCLGFALQAAAAGTRDELWKKVEEAQQKGLPKTAIESLGPIMEQATREKAWAEAVKAIGRKIALEGSIQGNKPEEKIVRMQAEIEKAPAEMKPVMNAILANWYWHYFQQNRWRFMQRTRTAEQPGADFTTWDLPRILAEIDRQFTTALAEEKFLKTIPVAEYDALLTKGTVPDTHRPTLFDVLAHNALEFYQAGEQAGSKAEDAFEIRADSPVFAPAAEFLKWTPESADEGSVTLRAVNLHRNLLAFHGGDKDKTAFIDADLLRLNFAGDKAVGEEKNERYKAALERLAKEWADHEISARARCHWAGALKEDGDLVEAHKVARQGADAFPDAAGGKMCWNLIQEIEARELSLQTERVWNAPWPTVNVAYRNVTKVHLRAVAWDFNQRLGNSGWGNVEYLDDNDRKALLGRKADLEWSADLPATDDYQQRVETLPAPKTLKPGFYFIVASHDPSFSDRNNQVTYAPVWVSDLAIVGRSRQNQGLVEGFVLKAASGEPVAGAAVKAYVRQDRNYTLLGQTETDENGLYRFTGSNNRNLIMVAQSGDHSLATRDYSAYVHDDTPKPYGQTVFFTDRSLYRPGQTIQYKGICIRVDQNQDNYQTLGGQALTVIFADVNGKEIARQSHKANDWGSFSGSFTAPRDRLMGRMQIGVAEDSVRGSASVTVEEYKRPKVQVAVDAPREAARLNAEVKVTGKATAYTGAAVGGAKVKWRVTRGVQYPVWWRWYCWWGWPRAEVREIAHGAATTATDGTFPVVFTAKPDLAVEEKDEPTFVFTVYADVTDTTGETRSAQRQLRAGYTALAATLAADDWLEAGKRVSVKVSTATLDGVGQAAEGTVRVYALKQPAEVARAEFSRSRSDWSDPSDRSDGKRSTEPTPDPSNPNSWELGAVAAEQPFKTDASGAQELKFDLKAGIYRAMLETRDRFGKPVTARLPVQVVDISRKQFAVRIPNHVAAPRWSLEPGDSFLALWGTGYEIGRAYVEIEHRRRIVKSFWTAKDCTQEVLEYPVNEEMRGGFTFRVTYVRENRAYLTSRTVDVPWSNKKLDVKWERFTSKLEPGARETWTAVITAPGAEKTVAEMVAGLYDASLDAYLPHNWMSMFNVWRTERCNLYSRFENDAQGFSHLHGNWPYDFRPVEFTYRGFPYEIIANLWGYGWFGVGGGGRGGLRRMSLANVPGGEAAAMDGMPLAAAAPAAEVEANGVEFARQRKKAGGSDRAKFAADKPGGPGGEEPAEEPDLSKVSARQNLNETAFFFPGLVSGGDGVVKMEFAMPEALTEWKFMGFAHDRGLRSGALTDRAVTAKDLMVEPNPPRFVREGDEIEFTVKVSNQSAARQTGKVRLTFADARTLKPVDALLGAERLRVPAGAGSGAAPFEQEFDIPSRESKTFAWRITIPDGMGFLTYKTVGSTGRLSDGEEGWLPVLSRRILVSESLPLPVRGKQTRSFEFTKLLDSGKSKTLRHETLTVQMVSQPAWYAVMALPYLMEYPYECTEQTFNRLYANALARHIANSDPKIRRVFDQWKGTPALDSPLEKNQDLKSVMLEETPWVRQAQDESQARRNVGVLFDANRLNDETARLLGKLADLQLGDGSWPWFPGGRGDPYITLYITTGFGRLRHLGAKDVDVACAVKALGRIDGWMDEWYREILKHGNKDDNHLSTTAAFYLYGRSFFLRDKAVAAGHREAFDYWTGQARKYWLRLDNRQSQAHIAVALNRLGDRETAAGVMKSIKERSVTEEEMGMYWRDTELSWWWYRAPIETQAMMIEAFDEVMGDDRAVEDCRVWLLKQKQTQDWKTTKATADAVYGLLLRGANWLASDALVEVSLDRELIKPEKVEAGTGFYEQRFVRGEIEPGMGRITVRKADEGVSWGSVHWQYLEDMSKVTPHEGTPLKLVKKIFVKEQTTKGPVLKPVSGPLAVGDELVVRIELRTDRDMEYVHMKDQRGSGTEPVNVLSRYNYQDGLAYYESTRDTASHFFIDYLPKGVYVFEYGTRVQLKGKYQTGIAGIQCMYAPEFNSHSESFDLEVK